MRELRKNFKLIYTNVILQKRYESSNSTTKMLAFFEFGEPADVMKICDDNVQCPKDKEVVVKIRASPVNPADINIIQGKYPEKPQCLPGVPGIEGVGEVIRLGQKASNLQEGDMVIPLSGGMGWWKNESLFMEDTLYKVPKDMEIAAAATLSSTPCTAYRMLKDYVSLKEGDAVIQNAANSSVGQMVIQLCKNWGVKTVNVVRERPNLDELVDFLKSLGADSVITENALKSPIKCKNIPKPKLGLNAVGGKNATQLLRQLDKNGYLVTYGGMSKKPIEVNVPPLVFKNITLVGFWVTAWKKQNLRSEKQMEMLEEIICLFKNGKLKPPVHQMVPFEDYQQALCNTLTEKGMVGKKFILLMNTAKECS